MENENGSLKMQPALQNSRFQSKTTRRLVIGALENSSMFRHHGFVI
jgi:hypothetical protein